MVSRGEEMMTKREFVSTAELAQVLRISPDSLRGLIRRGVLPPGTMVAGRRVFDSETANSAIDAYTTYLIVPPARRPSGRHGGRA